MDYAAVSAEQPFGGLRINIIPKEGGNSVRGSFFATGVTSAWQGTNIDDDLKAKGLPDPNEMKKAYDINPSVGGPLMRDKLWFYFSSRWQKNESYVAGLYENRNAGDPTKWLPDPDRSKRGVFRVDAEGREPAPHLAAGGRSTSCRSSTTTRGASGTTAARRISPESTVAYRFPVLNLAQVGWTSTMTSKLLRRGALRQPRRGVRQPVPGRGQHLPRAHPGHRAEHQPAVPRQGRRRRLERALRLQHAGDQHAHRRRCRTSPARTRSRWAPPTRGR